MDLRPHPNAQKRSYYTRVTFDSIEEYKEIRFCNGINNRGWLWPIYDEVTFHLPPETAEVPYIVSVSNEQLVRVAEQLHGDSIRFPDTETSMEIREKLRDYLSGVFAAQIATAKFPAT